MNKYRPLNVGKYRPLNANIGHLMKEKLADPSQYSRKLFMDQNSKWRIFIYLAKGSKHFFTNKVILHVIRSPI